MSKRSFKTRFSEHLYRIKYLSEYFSDPTKREKFNKNNVNCFLLYNHFAFNHNLESDLRFQIFSTNIINFRLRLETDLMYLLNTIHPNGLNSGPPFKLNTIENYNLTI